MAMRFTAEEKRNMLLQSRQAIDRVSAVEDRANSFSELQIKRILEDTNPEVCMALARRWDIPLSEEEESLLFKSHNGYVASEAMYRNSFNPSKKDQEWALKCAAKWPRKEILGQPHSVEALLKKSWTFSVLCVKHIAQLNPKFKSALKPFDLQEALENIKAPRDLLGIILGISRDEVSLDEDQIKTVQQSIKQGKTKPRVLFEFMDQVISMEKPRWEKQRLQSLMSQHNPTRPPTQKPTLKTL